MRKPTLHTQVPEHIAHGTELTEFHDLGMAVDYEVVAFEQDPTWDPTWVGSDITTYHNY